MTKEEDPVFPDELKEEAFRRILAKEAFERGEYELAFKEVKILAEKGFPDMQHVLGAMYLKGQGVKEDAVMSVMWFHVSAENGNEHAVKVRDALEKSLPPKQLAEAQKLAHECIEKNYKDCGC